MRKTLIATMLTLFLAAGLTPAVLAEEPSPSSQGYDKKEDKREYKDERKEDKKDLKEERQEYKEAKKDLREAKKDLKEERKEYKEAKKDFREKYGMRHQWGLVDLELNGTAVGRDNATYTFDLDAEGKGIQRVRMNVDAEGGVRYSARLVGHVVVMDDNGTIVKERDVHFRLLLRGDADGNAKWVLASVAKRDNGLPKLIVRGEADMTAAGAYDLSGQGRAVFQLDGHRYPVKIPDVEGMFTFTRPVADAPSVTAAKAPTAVSPAASSTATEPSASSTDPAGGE